MLEQSGAKVILTRSDENAIYINKSEKLRKNKLNDLKTRKEALNRQIQAIQADTKMPAAEKARKLAELNGKIANIDRAIAATQANTRQCRIQIERNENPRYQKCMERKKECYGKRAHVSVFD